MKKVGCLFVLIVCFFVVYFLQVNFFSWFTIAGVKPNLFIVFVLFISLFAGMKVGVPFGIFMGLFLDIIIGKNIGISAVMLGIIGFIGGYFDKNFSKESRITIMLMVVGSTCVFEIGSYFLQVIELSVYVEIVPFLVMLLIEIVYNTILTIILYPVMQRLGYRLEDNFKVKQILTRYF